MGLVQRAQEMLEQMRSNTQMLKYLDQKTPTTSIDDNDDERVTWTRLVRDVITYVQHQTDRITAGKLKNKDDALRKVAVCLRRIIKLADARGLRLHRVLWSALFPHVLHFLNKEVLESEYTIILKMLLEPPSGPVYAAYLGPKLFNQLVDHSCQRIESSTRMYCQRYSEILCRLLEYYPKDCHSRAEELLDFIAESIYASIASGDEAQTCSWLFGALLALVKRYGSDLFEAISRNAENGLNRAVAQLWPKAKSDLQPRLCELIEFEISLSRLYTTASVYRASPTLAQVFKVVFEDIHGSRTDRHKGDDEPSKRAQCAAQLFWTFAREGQSQDGNRVAASPVIAMTQSKRQRVGPSRDDIEVRIAGVLSLCNRLEQVSEVGAVVSVMSELANAVDTPTMPSVMLSLLHSGNVSASVTLATALCSSNKNSPAEHVWTQMLYCLYHRHNEIIPRSTAPLLSAFLAHRYEHEVTNGAWWLIESLVAATVVPTTTHAFAWHQVWRCAVHSATLKDARLSSAGYGLASQLLGVGFSSVLPVRSSEMLLGLVEHAKELSTTSSLNFIGRLLASNSVKTRQMSDKFLCNAAESILVQVLQAPPHPVCITAFFKALLQKHQSSECSVSNETQIHVQQLATTLANHLLAQELDSNQIGASLGIIEVMMQILTTVPDSSSLCDKLLARAVRLLDVTVTNETLLPELLPAFQSLLESAAKAGQIRRPWQAIQHSFQLLRSALGNAVQSPLTNALMFSQQQSNKSQSSFDFDSDEPEERFSQQQSQKQSQRGVQDSGAVPASPTEALPTLVSVLIELSEHAVTDSLQPQLELLDRDLKGLVQNSKFDLRLRSFACKSLCALGCSAQQPAHCIDSFEQLLKLVRSAMRPHDPQTHCDMMDSLLDMLSHLSRLEITSSTQQSRTMCISLVVRCAEIFTELCQAGKCNAASRSKLVDLVAALLNLDAKQAEDVSVEVFPLMVCDPDWHVRQKMLDAVVLLLRTFKEEQQGIVCAITSQEQFPLEFTEWPVAARVTACRLIARIARESAPNDFEMLYLLCRQYARDLELKPVIGQLLGEVATSLGYESAGPLIDELLPRLVARWIFSAEELSQFPHTLCSAHKTLGEVLRAVSDLVVPYMLAKVTSQQPETLLQLYAALSERKDAKRLMKESRNGALMWLACSNERMKKEPNNTQISRETQRLSDVIAQYVEGDKRKIDVDVLFSMLELGTDDLDVDEDGPLFKTDITRHAFATACAKHAANNRDSVSAVIEYIDQHDVYGAAAVMDWSIFYASTHRVVTQVDLLQRVHFLLRNFFKKEPKLLSKANMVRGMLMLLVRATASLAVGVSSKACATLRKSLFPLLVSRDVLSRKFMSRYLRVMVNAAAACVQRAEVKSEGLALLKDVVLCSKDYPELAQQLAKLSKLEACADFDEVNSALGKGPTGAANELQRYVQVGAAGGVLSLQQLSNALREEFATHGRMHLSAMLDSDTDWDLIGSALQLMVEQINCQGYMEHAASCLAVLTQIADPNMLAQLHIQATVGEQSRSSRKKKSGKDEVDSARVDLLRRLDNLSVNNTPTLMRQSRHCLRRLLCTGDGKALYRALEPHERDLLSVHNDCHQEVDINRSDQMASKRVDLDDIWSVTGKTFDQWVCGVTSQLVKPGGAASSDEVLTCCWNMCRLSVDVAQLLFPLAMRAAVMPANYDKAPQSVHDAVDKLAQLIQTHILGGDLQSTAGQKAMQSVLRALAEIRRCTLDHHSKKEVLRHEIAQDYILPIGYLDMAVAAAKVGSPFDAVMLMERWCEDTVTRRIDFKKASPDQFAFDSSLSHAQRQYLELARGLYSTEIDDPDALYAVDCGYDLISRVRQHTHEMDWGKALAGYDLLLQTESRTPALHEGMLSSMQYLGMNHVAAAYWKADGNAEISEELHEKRCEAAWRTMQWDASISAQGAVSRSGLHESVFHVLRHLTNNDIASAQTLVQHGRAHLIQKESGMLWGDLKQLLTGLQCFSLLDQAVNWKTTGSGVCIPAPRIVRPGAFLSMELSYCLHRTLLQVCCPESTKLSEHTCMMAKMARDAGQLSLAAGMLHNVESQLVQRRDAPSNLTQLSAVRLEQARVLWDTGDCSHAMRLAKAITCTLTQQIGSSGSKADSNAQAILGKALVATGEWVVESRTVNATKAIADYFLPGLTHCRDASSRADAYQALAQQHDALYKQRAEYANSAEWSHRLQSIEHMQQQLEELSRILRKLNTKKKEDASAEDDIKSISSTASLLRKNIEKDQQETKCLMNDQQKHLNEALKGYLKCLQYGSSQDVRVVARVITLWFDTDERAGQSDQGAQDAQSVFKSCELIPTHKFLPLLPQLVSRLGSGTTHFDHALRALVLRVAKDHIYHALLPLFALKNGGEAKQAAGQGNLRTGGSAAQSTVDDAKVKTVKELLQQLQQECSHHAATIQETEVIVSGYIELAELAVDKNNSKNMPLTRSLRNVAKSGIRHAAIVTASIPIEAAAAPDYSYVPKIQSFKGSFDLAASGINVPKVVECIGSNGNVYKQLVKLDETRQDAVMQQLYSMVNMLLDENDDTRKRQLKLRTYEIKPLSPCCGVLEWCNNTEPLYAWLKQAHTRIHPNDWSPHVCLQKLEILVTGTTGKQNSTKKTAKPHPAPSSSALLKEYQGICQHLHPVFHHYFYEAYTDSFEWFNCRRNYVRSVASNSIVGYILGLGDRHLNNILIDKSSGELVHIDFGITFEMGKSLPSPEKVPFRLTRDLVDGMGTNGTEGTFRRSCEATMRVLRSNCELLMAVAEVLRHDPLQRWALSPTAIAKQLNLPVSKANPNLVVEQDRQVVATNVLLKLRQRLKGIEQGDSLSVEGQIQMLINQATDQENLCMMYRGWQAYL